MKKAKVAVIVPCYNEARTVGFMLRSLWEWKSQDSLNRNAVFVNDGSTDGTGKILRTGNFDVVDASEGNRNLGKGGAFTKGLRHAYSKFNPDVIVALDADLVRSPVKAINRIVYELYSQKVHMVIAGSRERFRSSREFSSPVHDISGQRAIMTQALMPLIKGNGTWETGLQGYAMEAFFNVKIPLKYDSLATFYASEALRNTSTFPQVRQATRVLELLSSRERLGRLVRSAFRAHSERDPRFAQIFLSNVDEALGKLLKTGLMDERWKERFYQRLERKLTRSERNAELQVLQR